LPPRNLAHICRTETDAEERLVAFQRHADPFDFAADVIVAVIGAHRAAENDRGRMLGHGRRQRIAKARPPHVQRVAELLQSVAERPGVECSWCRTIRTGCCINRSKLVKPCTPVTAAAPRDLFCGVSRPALVHQTQEQRMREQAHERRRKPIACSRNHDALTGYKRIIADLRYTLS